MNPETLTRIEKSQAALLLGALGDALGAPIEFMKRADIIAKYGQNGIQALDVDYGVKGPVTDDTQMTLFLAESLVTAQKRFIRRGVAAPYWTYSRIAYLAWLKTQDLNNESPITSDWSSAELIDIVAKQGRRAPGNTCLSALAAVTYDSGFAENNSKGCGAIMRVAPIAIFAGNFLPNLETKHLQKMVYQEAVDDAAITHGHETAHHTNGVGAVIMALLLRGESFDAAVARAIEEFATEDIIDLLKRAVALSSQPPSAESLASLGEGWVAEEALAMSLYCATYAIRGELSTEDALRLAVNHDGDSDSTGAITGNLIGLARGLESVPEVLFEEDAEVTALQPLIRRYGEELVTVAEFADESLR